MHVPPQILLPVVEHQRERGGPAEPARIGRELGERRRNGTEEHLVERARRLSDESIQIMGQRKHEVKVRHRQHLALARREPGFLGPRLAARTMAVASGVIEVARGAAGLAGLHMPTEGGGGGVRSPVDGLPQTR
jgi:hypothetical protein